MVLRFSLGLVVTGAFAVAAYLGLWRWFGAHPYWVMQGAIVGGLIGAGIAAVLPPRLGLWLGALALVSGVIAAYFGKQAFVASFAENGLAGRFWFLGYQVALAGLAGVLVNLLARVLRTR